MHNSFVEFFDPICDCELCSKLRESAQVCYHCKKNKKRKPIKFNERKPDFVRYWKCTIPCETCQKDECCSKLLISNPCSGPRKSCHSHSLTKA